MSLETITRCPICSGHQFNLHLSVKDHSVSHGTFSIVRCNECSFLFTNPRPGEDEIGRYYESEDYISHHDDTKTLVNSVYNMVRNFTVSGKLNLIEDYDEFIEKRILDIGCGTGFFLSQCLERKWKTTGTEPDGDARNVAMRNARTDIYPDIFAEPLQHKKFTTITMWHVLEHVHKLNETLEWVRDHLEDSGTLFIAVPNPESHDALKYQDYWAAYDVPRHLYHFSKKNMSDLMVKHQLKIEEIKPMLFDSFYVSMLSTRYKKGRVDAIDTFLTGTISNLKGLLTSRNKINTSSLIYIVRKNNR